MCLLRLILLYYWFMYKRKENCRENCCSSINHRIEIESNKTKIYCFIILSHVASKGQTMGIERLDRFDRSKSNYWLYWFGCQMYLVTLVWNRRRRNFMFFNFSSSSLASLIFFNFIVFNIQLKKVVSLINSFF